MLALAPERSSRVAFIGGEEIGFACLEALLRVGAKVVGVWTLGEQARDDVVAFRSFAPFAGQGVPVWHSNGALCADDIAQIAAAKPDIIYAVGCSQLLPTELLTIPTIAAVRMHCSLLPRHRGRAPIPWSVILGLRRSGVTLFHLSREADRGDIIGQEAFPIAPHDTAGDIYRKAVRASVSLIEVYHALLTASAAPRIQQDLRRSDYWPKRTPQDGLIDWDTSAACLYSWVRALTHPFPGAFTYWRDRKLFIWEVHPAGATSIGPAGSVVELTAREILVNTGEGSLAITSLQMDCEEELRPEAFLSRHQLRTGDVFG